MATRAVVKMLKKGVTKETLDMEEELTMKILKELSSSADDYAKTEKCSELTIEIGKKN